MLEFILGLDSRLFLYLNSVLTHPLLDSFFITITNGRFWIAPGIAIAVVALRIDRRRAMLAIGLALLTVAITDPVCSRILKPFFGRPRPCHPDFLVEGARFLIGLKHSLSFPSAHAMNSFGQAALISRFYPATTPYAFLIAALIAYSRIYVGVHYPADVLVGAIAGFCVGTVVYSSFFMAVSQIRRRSGPEAIGRTHGHAQDSSG